MDNMLWQTWEAMNLKIKASKLGIENPEAASCPCYPWIHDLTNTAAPIFSNFLWLQWVWGSQFFFVALPSWHRDQLAAGLSTHSPCPPLVSGPLCFRPALSPVCRPSVFPHNMVSQWIAGSPKKPFHGVMYKAMCFGFSLLFTNFVQNNFNFSAICFLTHSKHPKKTFDAMFTKLYVFWFQFTVHEFCSICFSAH